MINLYSSNFDHESTERACWSNYVQLKDAQSRKNLLIEKRKLAWVGQFIQEIADPLLTNQTEIKKLISELKFVDSIYKLDEKIHQGKNKKVYVQEYQELIQFFAFYLRQTAFIQKKEGLTFEEASQRVQDLQKQEIKKAVQGKINKIPTLLQGKNQREQRDFSSIQTEIKELKLSSFHSASRWLAFNSDFNTLFAPFINSFDKNPVSWRDPETGEKCILKAKVTSLYPHPLYVEIIRDDQGQIKKVNIEVQGFVNLVSVKENGEEKETFLKQALRGQLKYSLILDEDRHPIVTDIFSSVESDTSSFIAETIKKDVDDQIESHIRPEPIKELQKLKTALLSNLDCAIGKEDTQKLLGGEKCELERVEIRGRNGRVISILSDYDKDFARSETFFNGKLISPEDKRGIEDYRYGIYEEFKTRFSHQMIDNIGLLLTQTTTINMFEKVRDIINFGQEFPFGNDTLNFYIEEIKDEHIKLSIEFGVKILDRMGEITGYLMGRRDILISRQELGQNWIASIKKENQSIAPNIRVVDYFSSKEESPQAAKEVMSLMSQWVHKAL